MDEFLQVVCYDGYHRPETSYSNVNSLINRERGEKFEKRKSNYDKCMDYRDSRQDYDKRMTEYRERQGYECREGKINDKRIESYRYTREDIEKRIIDYRDGRFDFERRVADCDNWQSFEKRMYYDTNFGKPVDYVLPDKQNLNRMMLDYQSRLNEPNKNYSERKELNDEKQLLHCPSKKIDSNKDKNPNNNDNLQDKSHLQDINRMMLNYQSRINEIQPNCSENKTLNNNKQQNSSSVKKQDKSSKICDKVQNSCETLNVETEVVIKNKNDEQKEEEAKIDDKDETNDVKSDKSEDSDCNSDEDDPIKKRNRLDHSRYVKGKKRGPKLKKTPEKTFPCQLCTYSSTRKHDLKRHFKRVHHNNPNHVPSQTENDKKKRNQIEITDDDMTEDGKIKHSVIVRGQKRGPKMKHVYDKTYPCTLCTYASTRPFDLKRHVSTVHKKEKPFSCDICSFSAGLAETLKQHILKMHNDTKYKCASCNFTCAKKLEYMRHLKDDHNYMPYSCESCDFSCMWNIELVQHRTKVHGK